MSRLRWSIVLLVSVLFVAGCNAVQSPTPTQQALPPALSQGQAATPQAAAPGAATKPSTQAGGQAPAAQPTAAAKGQSAPAQGGQSPSAATKGDGTIAAMVNGEPIQMADYQREATQARSFLMSDPKFSASTAEGQQALQTINNQVLESLIGEALIRQYAQKNGLTITDTELNQSLDSLIKDMGGDQEFEKALAARGLTREMFTATQRTQLLGNKVRDAVTTDVPQTMEQVHARHILVQTPDQAAQALNRLNKGEDFAKVAREVSQDPSTASAGGDLGWFPRGLMVPEFEQAAFNLKPNELSPAIQTQFGYHIIQVLEKDANRKLPDERWQELRQMKFQDWLEDQRDAAKIERFVQ